MEDFFPLKTFKNTVIILSKNMDLQECESVAYMVMEKAFFLSRTDIFADRAFQPDDAQRLKYEVIMSRLKQNEPIQYILKEAEFYGHSFYVNTNVLIPRQETEYLIQIIRNLKDWQAPKIADIGTGSGCIACTLSLELENSIVCGYDVSLEALKIAEMNGRKLGANIEVQKLDVLNESIKQTDFDLIISNPPYVTFREKVHMHNNVLDYEPHLALFVPDENPLIFYKAIMEKAKTSLKNGGLLFFEINEQFGKNVMLLFQHYGYDNPIILKDLNDKQRFVYAKLVE
ncbi:MAG: peptide chain release factor N(5)-glutamine methyltransferase [Bacteroidota bacterium]